MLYQNDFYYLGLIVLMPLIGAIINGVLGAKLPKKLVDLIACGSILTSFFFTLLSIRALVENGQGEGVEKVYGHLSYTAYQWIYAGDFGVDIAFFLDPLTALLLLLITGVGFLIHLYSVGYMEHDESKWRYFSYLNLFCFAMLLLVGALARPQLGLSDSVVSSKGIDIQLVVDIRPETGRHAFA